MGLPQANSMIDSAGLLRANSMIDSAGLLRANGVLVSETNESMEELALPV